MKAALAIDGTPLCHPHAKERIDADPRLRRERGHIVVLLGPAQPCYLCQVRDLLKEA